MSTNHFNYIEYNFYITMSLNAKKRKIIVIFAVFFFVFFILGHVVIADNYNNYGLDDTLNTGNLKEALITDAPATTIGKIIGAGLAFIGILFFILMIYGGFTWMFARGNEQTVEKAKDLIMSAVIGLVIVLAAYAITVYVGGALTAAP